MYMYKKILISVILVILSVLVFSGNVAAKEVLSAEIKLKDGTVVIGEVPIILVKIDGKSIKVEDIASIRFITEEPAANSIEEIPKGTVEESFRWKKKEGIIVTATGNRVEGCDEFVDELIKVIPNATRWGSRHLLDFTESNKDLGPIVSTHTIFTVRPDNLEELENLEDKYPQLLPMSCTELKSYSFPLVCLSLDSKGRIRGVIITYRIVILPLAKLLTRNALPLDTPFWYDEDGQLQLKQKK
jgi:uncharacterized membrane protein